MNLAKIGHQMEELVIFQNLKHDPLVAALMEFISAGGEREKSLSASAVAAALYPEGVDLTAAVLDRILKDDHFYVRQRAAGSVPDPLILAQLQAELEADRKSVV